MVLHPLDEDVLAGDPLDDLVGLGAGRTGDVAVEPLRLVLRLAVDQHRATAGDREEKADARLVEDEADGVVVDDLEFRTAQLGHRTLRRIVDDVELVAVRDVGSGHRPKAVMPLGVRVEVEGPDREIVIGLPALGEAVATIGAGQGIVADQPAECRKERDVGGRGPVEVGVGIAGLHADHQPIDGCCGKTETAISVPEMRMACG